MIEAIAPNHILPLLQCYVAMPLLVVLARYRHWLRRLDSPSLIHGFFRGVLCLFLCVWTPIVILVLAGFHLSRVEGESMAPTFSDGQWVVSSGNAYALHWPFWGRAAQSARLPDRGDVVTFYYYDPKTRSPAMLIKRVVGLPGDVIRQHRGGMSINGSLVQPMGAVGGNFVVDGHFVQFSSLTSAFPWHAEWVVGPGEVFVMGDHWDGSWDSRMWGSLPVSRIATKVVSHGRKP